MKNKMGSSTLVKIDKEIYDVIQAFVEKNKVEYPSIKNFIDRAALRALSFKKYDIEGIDYRNLEDRPLKRVVGESKKVFFMCKACDKPFLKYRKDTGEASKICSKCKEMILHFAPKLKEERKS